MPRTIRVAAAQMGPNSRTHTRDAILDRMIHLLDQAATRGATLVVFPELPFTTFFPRWVLSGAELDAFYETEMPNAATQRLFDRARTLGVGLHVGYAERTPDGQRFNAAILTDPAGATFGKYRKVHLPGTTEPRPNQRFQQLEKRYFDYGDLGFPAFPTPSPWPPGVVGMLICNDRRWPEAWRVLGLQGVELVCVGYNSAAYDPYGGTADSDDHGGTAASGPYTGTAEDAALRTFHSKLVVQANAYMNATWAVAVAKAGDEDGSGLIGGSCIVNPNGVIVAEATTLDDELLVADLDLDACRQGKEKMFNFAAHRRPQWYTPLTTPTGTTTG